MRIQFTRACLVKCEHQNESSIAEFDDETAKYLIACGAAILAPTEESEQATRKVKK